jgi:hypothetical protein
MSATGAYHGSTRPALIIRADDWSSRMKCHEGNATVETPAHRGDTGGLVIRAADGDDRAWQELVARFSDVVSSATVAHRLSEDDTVRVAATVWQRLRRNLGKLRQPDRVGAWLGAVARDECVKALRQAA